MMRRDTNSIVRASKNLSIRQNVCLQVIDEITGKVVQEHVGHNSATNSLLFGIAHHLIGDFRLNQGYAMHPGYDLLSNYVPRYISLGTMGLINQEQDINGLPAGIGDNIPNYNDPEYKALQEAYQAALAAYKAAVQARSADCPIFGKEGEAPAACADCEVCSRRIDEEDQAVEATKATMDAAYEALLSYSEEQRFIEYMTTRPGYGADGYDQAENNGRKYPGLGYAYTTFDNTARYYVGQQVMYKGVLYSCILDTPDPAGVLDPAYWQVADDAHQPSKGTIVKLELVSPSFPREPISYRDVVPEYQSENPKTIDVVFSAMISTGALKQFRPKDADGKDLGYIFITEAGLWSKRDWEGAESRENGLLAGYRIIPPNRKNWDMTDPENREILKRQILKVGRNQVVQVVWKIQLIADDEYIHDDPGPSGKISLDASGEIWNDVEGMSWQDLDDTHVW